MNRLYRLLSFGYFPKELPPVFHTAAFASAFQRNLPAFQAIVDRSWRRPTSHLLQQRAYYKRTLSIVNPASFAALAQDVATNYSQIQALLSRSKISVSSPRFNRRTKFFRAVGSSQMGASFRDRKIEIRSQFPVILRFDVKNFYRSIYTHSIPWSIHSKGTCKSNISRPRPQRQLLFGDTLDEGVRNGQEGQTIGIPVGPDTSFIIAEMLLSAVDHKMGFVAGQGVRFYDDYEIGCNSNEEAEAIIIKMESVLAEYELELNHEKTRIIKGESISDSWPFTLRQSTKSTNFDNREDLIDLHNLASNTALNYPEANVLKYFIRQMRRTVLPASQWNLWQDLLYASGFAEKGTLREIFEQLDLYSQISGYNIDKKKLKCFLTKKIALELGAGSGTELSWAVFGLSRFDIKVERDLIISVIKNGDDICRILALQYAARKRIGVKRAVADLMTLWEPDVFKKSRHWLLMWELYINQWVTDQNLNVDVANDPFFNLLNTHQVSFIRPPSADLLEVPFPFRQRMAADRLQHALQNNLYSIISELDVGDTENEEDNSPQENGWSVAESYG